MAKNFPGPYEVRIKYISPDGLEHVGKWNAIVAGEQPVPGADPEDIMLVTRGSSIDLQAGVDAFWTAFRSRISDDTIANSFEFWRYPSSSGTPEFVSSGTLTQQNGAVDGTMVESQEEIRTYRTGLGGIMRVNVLDTVTPGKYRVPLNNTDLITAFVLGNSGWLIGRDDAFPIGAMNLSLGENEALFKIRHR